MPVAFTRWTPGIQRTPIGESAAATGLRRRAGGHPGHGGCKDASPSITLGHDDVLELEALEVRYVAGENLIGGRLDLQLRPGSEVEAVAERLRHHHSSRTVDGSDHPIMVFHVALSVDFRW